MARAAMVALGICLLVLSASQTRAADAGAALAFVDVAGAPGDGEQALAAALRKRLLAAGVKPASTLADNVYSVEGIVQVTQAKSGKQSVRIDWTIFDPDGNQLGFVTQTNDVRKGSLDKSWGAAADEAAGAAIGDILKLLPH